MTLLKLLYVFLYVKKIQFLGNKKTFNSKIDYSQYINHQSRKTTNPKKLDLWLEEDFYNKKKNIFINLFERYKDYIIDKKCLSIGSRVGNEVLALKNFTSEVIGIDIVPYKDLVIKGDMHNLEFKDNQFDFIFTNIIDHSLYPQRFFDQVYSKLKHGGVFFLQCSLKNDEDDLTVFLFKNKKAIKSMGSKFQRIEFKYPSYESLKYWGFETEVLFYK